MAKNTKFKRQFGLSGEPERAHEAFVCLSVLKRTTRARLCFSSITCEYSIIRIYESAMVKKTTKRPGTREKQAELRRYKAEIFQALAHSTRIAILDRLRDGEVATGVILSDLGLEQSNASQHLALLRAKKIVVSRKVGNMVYYSLYDPMILEVLDILHRYFKAHLNEALEMLGELRKTVDGQ